MSITFSGGPLTLLYLIVPSFHSDAAMRRFRSRLFLKEIVVVTRGFLFKLPAHVLHTVPVLLPAARQCLPAIASHYMTSYLKRVLRGQEDDRFTDLGDRRDARHRDVLDGSVL